MINCYLKTIKFANYFVPIIPSKHRPPCLLAVGRETINVKLTACSCHVTYAFQSESTLYSLAKWLSVHLRTKWFWSSLTFEQGVPRHSRNYRVWIYSETCT